jgi:hypothetical protein
MMDLNFENGFWLPTGFPEENELAVDNMWKNFKKYCSSTGNYTEWVLSEEFNAIAHCFADDNDLDNYQWFVRFKTAEDYTYFVMRFG